jgi:SOS-response transcriptional repressor LexA
MNAWSTRVRKRMKQLGMTQDTLAKKMGITRGAITHYLAGRRTPSLLQFKKMAAVLKTDPAWLQFGISTTSELPHTPNKTNATAINKSIPILTWEQITDFIDVDNLEFDEPKEFIPNHYTDQTRWFALRVKGDSMIAPLAQKNSFYENSIIIIDPDKTVSNGDFVIAQLPKTKEAIFKQYVVDGGKRYLKPLNPQYPLIEIDDKTHLFGVIIQSLTMF